MAPQALCTVIQPVLLSCARQRLDPIAHLQLAEDLAHPPLDRPQRHRDAGRNFLLGESPAQQLENSNLRRGSGSGIGPGGGNDGRFIPNRWRAKTIASIRFRAPDLTNIRWTRALIALTAIADSLAISWFVIPRLSIRKRATSMALAHA
jgi:hypothetical protein